MIWPGNPMASALILFAIAMPFLYAGRKVVHDLFRSIGHMIGGPLRLGAPSVFSAGRGVKDGNKADLPAHRRAEGGQRIEPEFRATVGPQHPDHSGHTRRH